MSNNKRKRGRYEQKRKKKRALWAKTKEKERAMSKKERKRGRYEGKRKKKSCKWGAGRCWSGFQAGARRIPVRQTFFPSQLGEYWSVCTSRRVGGSHRVGRVISFSPVVGIGTPPTPHPQASVPPTHGTGGRGTLAGDKGVGESHFRRGDIHCGTLYIYVLCGEDHSSFQGTKKPVLCT